MGNLLATQKCTKTPFNYHRKGSSIGYDGGVDSSAQQGKNLHQKIVFILLFLLTSQSPHRQQDHQYHLRIIQKTVRTNMYTTINRHGASLSLKGPSKGNARRAENKARQRQRQRGVAVVNGQPITATPERSASVIDGEEVSVTFEGDDVIVIC